MAEFLKRTWAEINLDAILHNYRGAKAASGGDVLAVVKADAYGHGVQYVAPALQAEGANWFGVSNLEEALQLRHLGIRGKILILGFTPPEFAPVLASENLSQAVFSSRFGKELSRQAATAGVRVQTHLKLDTGMNRLGFNTSPEGVETSCQEILELYRQGNLIPEGIFTHFASSDMDGDAEGVFTQEQSHRFWNLLKMLEREGLIFETAHLYPSGGIFTRSADRCDLARPGIMLYGYSPSSELDTSPLRLHPALSVKSTVIQLKWVTAGETVGYGRTYTAESDCLIATVPIGYADGYPRSLSNRAEMLIRGRRAKITGRVCMDQLMLDVTEIPGVSEGDTVTVIGADGDEFVSAAELAALAGTISYEILCLISKRVPRIFYQNGKEVGRINYIMNSFQ